MILLIDNCKREEDVFITWIHDGDLSRFADDGCKFSEMENVREDVWTRFPSVLSYILNIPWRQRTSYTVHGDAVRNPCMRCLVTMDDIFMCKEAMEDS